MTHQHYWLKVDAYQDYCRCGKWRLFDSGRREKLILNCLGRITRHRPMTERHWDTLRRNRILNLEAVSFLRQKFGDMKREFGIHEKNGVNIHGPQGR